MHPYGHMALRAQGLQEKVMTSHSLTCGTTVKWVGVITARVLTTPVTWTRFCGEQVRFSYIDTGLNGLAFVRLYRAKGEAGPGPAQLAEAVVRRTMETKRCKTRLAALGLGGECQVCDFSWDWMGGWDGRKGDRMALSHTIPVKKNLSTLCRLMRSWNLMPSILKYFNAQNVCWRT